MALQACYIPQISNSGSSYISAQSNSQWQVIKRQVNKSRQQSQYLTRTEHLVLLAGEMCEFLKLERGWNSYDSEKPTREAIERASGFLGSIGLASITPSAVMPSAEGGIAIRFKSCNRRALVEFLNNGDLEISLYDTTGNTEASPNEIGSTEELANSLERYLAGE